MEHRPHRVEEMKRTDGYFVDFKRFEDDKEARRVQHAMFMDDEAWSPDYQQPMLDKLYDAKVEDDKQGNDPALEEKKRAIYEAVLELEAARLCGEYDEADLALWVGYYELSLKKIMLVEAARRLRYSAGSSELPVTRAEFMQLNEEVFGSFDTQRFNGMMSSEQHHFAEFTPTNEKAEAVKRWLGNYYEQNNYQDAKEVPLLDDVLIEKMQAYVNHQYGEILNVVPDTGDEVVYDAQASQAIMQAALVAGGLAEHGWVAEIKPKIGNPTTSSVKRKISIPETTQRTAAELRRLIIHEQEVHARRGENGTIAHSILLQRGTANYADVEEGLGVILESVVAGNADNPSYHRARDRYIVAGLALGADGTPRDARATYEAAWRLIALRDAKDGSIDKKAEQAAKKRAITHIENAFRATDGTGPGMIYTKLKVYFEGLAKNAEFFKEYENNLDEAFAIAMIGKYDHTDPEERRNIQLLYSRAA